MFTMADNDWSWIRGQYIYKEICQAALTWSVAILLLWLPVWCPWVALTSSIGSYLYCCVAADMLIPSIKITEPLAVE